jgi:hypothetical protein
MQLKSQPTTFQTPSNRHLQKCQWLKQLISTAFLAFALGLAIAYAKFSLICIIFCGQKPRTVYQSGSLSRL